MKEFFRMLGELKYMIPVLRYKWPDPDSNASLAQTFQDSTEKFGDRPFVFFEDETWTYSEANMAANSFARYLVASGVQHGDRVVLFMENRPYYVISLLALNKIGAIGVLINTSLTGDPLIHCINSSDSTKCIVGAERAKPLEDVLDQINISNKDDLLWVEDNKDYEQPDWATDLKNNLDFNDNENLEETNLVTSKDTACYIFTSGTTGVPKAAVLPNRKLIALLEYDVAEDEILKDADGYCKKISNHEPGLLAIEIGPNAVFNGYTDKEASEKKILRNVFKDGDAWFNTGDLIKTVDVGFAFGKEHYQFVDRVGDTFRWRSENVSTNEVGEILNGYADVNMSNVYGVSVPGCEGRAGMAAFSLEDADNFNWTAFSEHVENNLPKYARPLFIRIIQEMDTTGTFKLKKNELRDESFDLNKVNDMVYCLKPSSNSYELLDRDWLDKINSCEAGY